MHRALLPDDPTVPDWCHDVRYRDSGDDHHPQSKDRLHGTLDALILKTLASVWTAERAEQWWTTHRPRPRDARPVADVLLSQEGHELPIGPEVAAAGLGEPRTRP